MSSLLAVLIGVVILLCAYILSQVALEVLEESHHFWTAIIGFFILYVLAAVGIYFLVLHPEEQPNISEAINAFFSILPAQLEQTTLR